MDVKISTYTHLSDNFNRQNSDCLDFDDNAEGVFEATEYLWQVLDYVVEETLRIDGYVDPTTQDVLGYTLDQTAQDILDYVMMKNHIELPEHASIAEFAVMQSTEVNININESFHKHFNNMHECYQWLNDEAVKEISNFIG